MSHSEPVQEGSTTRAQEMLLAFLREHEVDPPGCPVCGYNLRALTKPVCPECGQELTLTVGVRGARLQLGWLLAAVAPGFFSGLAGLFLLMVIVVAFVFDGMAPPFIIALDAFGLCSGGFALFLVARRIRFIAQPLARQRLWALAIWAVHIAALFAFILTVL